MPLPESSQPSPPPDHTHRAGQGRAERIRHDDTDLDLRTLASSRERARDAGGTLSCGVGIKEHLDGIRHPKLTRSLNERTML